MKKEISFGKIAYTSKAKRNLVELEIDLKMKDGLINYETMQKESGYIFTASGCVWNSSHTDHEMGGQCIDTLAELVQNPLLQEIQTIWRKYHLNDLKAGTKLQEEAIEKWESEGNKYDYTKAKDYLTSIGLNPHNGYEYGSAWLYMPIPEMVIQRIKEIIEQ